MNKSNINEMNFEYAPAAPLSSRNTLAHTSMGKETMYPL